MERNYSNIEIARALSTSGFKLVPDIVAGGGESGGSSGSLINILVANMIKDRMAPINIITPVESPIS